MLKNVLLLHSFSQTYLNCSDRLEILPFNVPILHNSHATISKLLRRLFASGNYLSRRVNLTMAVWRYNMEGLSEDMWSPYKQLYKVIQQTLANPIGPAITELEINLKKYKQVFTILLRNPPKSDGNRSKLCKGIIEGLSGHGYNRNIVFSKDLVDESIIISDMFELDEFMAMELLCTAQRQMSLHPGLPRGLVAILLYYDGRKAIACALRDLFQVTCGMSWVTDLPKELVYLISSFTQSLIDDANVIERIIDILENLDASKEIMLLAKNRALGPKKHQNQVLELFEDIRLALSTTIFNWSAQRGLSKLTVIKLIKSLSKYKSIEASGSVDDVTLTMLMALMYSYDASALQRHEDNNPFLQNMPFMTEPQFIQEVYDTFCSDYLWENKNRIESIAKFSFGLSLARLRQAPESLENSMSKLIERDEHLIDEALSNNVFEFIYHNVLARNIIYDTEFFYRRIHLLFTDFIDLMHSKLTELRGKADETAKTLMSFNKEGLEPPANLDHNFEMLMLCIGKFYKDNRARLSLCTEYWGPLDMSSSTAKSTARSVSLFKFIHLAGELLPTSLFVPYLKMIVGLTSCERSARSAFNLLKQSSQLSSSTTLSWEHFFGSLTRYYTNLRQEQGPGSDTIYRSKPFNRSINPVEAEGLHTVLEIIEAVAKYDEIARISICEHPSWAPLHILLGLLSCSVPLTLKASILKTLSALATSKESAIQLWHNLEASQIIKTIPTTNSYNMCNLEVEIEQNECRLERYPLSKAVLDLLFSLVTTIIPKNLGGGPRKPGFDPYLTFIINGIFLKFYNRAYKSSAEKWEIAEKCLKILQHLLQVYEVIPTDFDENRDQNPPAGFHLMLQLHTKSDVLRLLLIIIDDARSALDDFKKFPGKETLEECGLHCLNILESGLTKQDLFFEAHSLSNSSILLSGLNKIILDVNPRSKQPDHILNTTKFITYSSWLPRQALVAVKILNIVTRLPNVSSQILDMFTQNAYIEKEIRHGFVECLEQELVISPKHTTEVLHDATDGVKIDLQIKEAIIELLQNCLQQPVPNITHFLLGFEAQQDPFVNQRLGPNSFDSTSNCTKSLILLLDNHLELTKTIGSCDVNVEKVVELAYALLFSLCANVKTSDIILRYLRSYDDFLYRHLAALPFKNNDCSYVLHQMSYLLKCAAIELKIIAHNCQISRFQHFCGLLVGTFGKTKRDDIPMELSHNYSHPNHVFFETALNAKPQKKISDVLLCRLVDGFEFGARSMPMPKFEFFDNSMTEQILKECEVSTKKGLKLVNVKKLNETLTEELRTVQSTIASGQRKLILQEIEAVLLFAVKINNDRNKGFAAVKLMEAWSQTTEILFSCTPESAMPVDIKKDLILEILQKVLTKVVSVETNYEMAIIASGTILLLLVNLRNCYEQNTNIADFPVEENIRTTTTSEIKKINVSLSGSNACTLSLKFVTKYILEWIVASGFTSQKLRIYLYAALLNCLRIISKNQPSEIANKKYERFVSRLDKSSDKSYIIGLNHINTEILTSFSDELIDIICNDSITGHDICKMTALSCVDVLLNTDNMPSLINFIANRGYLSHIINSLLESDEQLCRVLYNYGENLKPLYIYESKMAVLIRLASCHSGAEILLVEKTLETLSRMKVFDIRPDIQVNMNNSAGNKAANEFIPTLDARFRQVLFPALSLCDSIISTLGTENHSALTQVMYFVQSHCDMFEMVLRTGSPYANTSSLRELAAVTGLIARITNQEIMNDPYNNSRVNLHRLQSLMLSAFSRFIINDTIYNKMISSDNEAYDLTDQSSSIYVKLILKIASNLSLFCRNVVANHTVDHKANCILFYPNIAESIHTYENPGNNIKRTYSLGMVLDLLKGAVEYFNYQLSSVENLVRQSSSLANINFDTAARKTYSDFTELLINKRREIVTCVYIVEQCLFLMWSHLDFFVSRPLDNSIGNANFIISKSQNLDTFHDGTVSLEDIVRLKKILVSVFNETFCKKLLSKSETVTEVDNRFNEALLRRIKNLIQLISVK